MSITLIYTLSLHDALPICPDTGTMVRSPIDKRDKNMQAAGGMYSSLNDLARWLRVNINNGKLDGKQVIPADVMQMVHRSEEHTSELQSRLHLVCRLLLEKK